MVGGGLRTSKRSLMAAGRRCSPCMDSKISSVKLEPSDTSHGGFRLPSGVRLLVLSCEDETRIEYDSGDPTPKDLKIFK